MHFLADGAILVQGFMPPIKPDAEVADRPGEQNVTSMQVTSAELLGVTELPVGG